eukprot:g7661.t1
MKQILSQFTGERKQPLSFQELNWQLDIQFICLFCVCWLAIIAVILWLKRSSLTGFLTNSSVLLQSTKANFQNALKSQKALLTNYRETKGKAQQGTSKFKCYCLVVFLLPTILLVYQLATDHKLGFQPATISPKKEFPQVQLLVDKFNTVEEVSVENFLDRLESIMREWFPILYCKIDESLLEHQPIQDRLFIASNLINCEKTMPNFILQLLKLITLYNEDQIRVSIYESGSTDMTPSWLVLLQTILTKINVTNSITVHGNLVRDANEDRIEFLAKIRNEAIAPMIQWSRDDSSPWKAQKVVFINDVYFCAQHILRLLLHKDEDVVCGMDFTVRSGWLPKQEQRKFMVLDLKKRFHLPRYLAVRLSEVALFLRKWRHFLSSSDYVRLQLPFAFYDRWAATDINGVNFIEESPITSDPASNELLHEGYPIYVHSCWNGLILLNANPLLQNLRFRAHHENECTQSECFFICHDYTDLGFDRIMIDPGVRVAYDFVTAEALYNSINVRKLPFVPWDVSGVRNHTALVRRHPTNVSCCVLPNGTWLELGECITFDYSSHQFLD